MSKAAPSPKKIRILGVLLIAIGLFLLAMAAGLTAWLQDVMLHHRSNWHGAALFTRRVFTLFESLGAFGAVALLGGFVQIATGRRQRWLQVLVLIGVAAVVFCCWSAMSAGPNR